MKDTIYYRLKPCDCGCSGQDPHHQQTYKRIIKDIVGNIGKVKLPMSTRPVTVVKNEYDMWVVDRNSIIFDKYG